MPLQQDSEKKGSNREWQGACDLNSPQVSPKPPFLPLWLPIAEWWISWGGVWGGYFMGRCPTARCSMPPKSNLHLPLSLSLSPPYSTHPYIVPTISLPFFIYYFFKSLPPSLTLTPLWCIQLKTIHTKHKKI